MRVAIYIRVSTKMQVDRYSLEDQENTCKSYAAMRDWTIVDIYADRGLSGKRDDRAELERLKKDAQRRRFDVVLVFKLNRFARNVPAQYAVAAELERYGIDIQSATESFERKTAAGKLTFGMLAVIAQFDSDQQSERVASAKRQQAERGDWVGPVPYGYERSGKTLRPSADAEVVKLIFEHYATGDWSDRTIADELNHLGHRTFDWQTHERNLFGRESVRTILKNPAYYGIVRCADQEYSGNHTPLVSSELWHRCQAVRKERDRGGRGHTKGDGWLLSRVARCAACDHLLWTHFCGHKKNLRYYGCAGREKRVCDSRLIRADIIEEQMLDAVFKLILPGDWKKQALAVIERLCKPEQARPVISRKMIEDQLKRLALVYSAGDIDEVTYQAERTRLRARLEETNGQPIVKTTYDAQRAIEMLDSFAEQLHSTKPEHQRRVMRYIFAAVWAEPHEIIAVNATPLYTPMLAAVEEMRLEGERRCPMGDSIPLSPFFLPYWIAYQVPYVARA